MCDAWGLPYSTRRLFDSQFLLLRINTELLTEFLAQQDDPEAVKEENRDMHPLGIGEPEDIAWAAVYLASDESKYMTGAPMLVEGGILTL